MNVPDNVPDTAGTMSLARSRARAHARTGPDKTGKPPTQNYAHSARMGGWETTDRNTVSSTDPVPQDDPELIAIMGANLTAQFTPAARATLKWEASKFPGGVARVVAGVLADASVRNPCAVILDRIAREQHHDLTTPPAPPPPGARRLDPPIAHEPSPTCPTCGNLTRGYRPVTDGCRTCGRPN